MWSMELWSKNIIRVLLLYIRLNGAVAGFFVSYFYPIMLHWKNINNSADYQKLINSDISGIFQLLYIIKLFRIN